ncbi:uncharacterized protein EI90DRAFT_3101387 [Cantharellus anzutake]|uniref:uncharacterized protein n=1 Tax=Cantharellus anzutake TaxID=1750568 RepID=UPI001906AA82|nr:uncharacterized protein EI90DRAFT_3101387 [Cantharellus anzutake]KAF8310439.1 hypothetical protein EI90DRAFT_3101387 [Cantharellus anzutake]
MSTCFTTWLIRSPPRHQVHTPFSVLLHYTMSSSPNLAFFHETIAHGLYDFSLTINDQRVLLLRHVLCAHCYSSCLDACVAHRSQYPSRDLFCRALFEYLLSSHASHALCYSVCIALYAIDPNQSLPSFDACREFLLGFNNIYQQFPNRFSTLRSLERLSRFQLLALCRFHGLLDTLTSKYPPREHLHTIVFEHTVSDTPCDFGNDSRFHAHCNSTLTADDEKLLNHGRLIRWIVSVDIRERVLRRLLSLFHLPFNSMASLTDLHRILVQHADFCSPPTPHSTGATYTEWKKN